MNKISSEKKKHIMMVGGGALALLAVLYLFVVTAQLASLADDETKLQEAQGKLDDAEKKIMMGKMKLEEYEQNKIKLAKLESSLMAPANKNDWKTWMVLQLQNIRTNKHPGIVLQEVIMEPSNEVNEELLPKVDFSAARFRVPIVAYYQDLGKYIADIENREPHLLRVENLTIQPDITPGAATTGEGRSEKLLATMHIVALVRSASGP